MYLIQVLRQLLEKLYRASSQVSACLLLLKPVAFDFGSPKRSHFGLPLHRSTHRPRSTAAY